MVKIVKKRSKVFRRHQSAAISKGNCFCSLGKGWRKPRGIDSAVRRRFKGTTLMPKIGYGSAKATRHMLPNGKKKFLVKNASDMELVLMHADKLCVELAHNLCKSKRASLIERARQIGVRVTNS